MLRQLQKRLMATANKRILLINGVSGCGKSTLIHWLMEKYPNKFGFSVSHTTRQPRQGERDGVDYHYIDKEQFEKMIENGEFLEHAKYNLNYYGTSKKAVDHIIESEEGSKICILDLELNGAYEVKRLNLPAHMVVVFPPSLEEVRNRLNKRGTETEESVTRRIETAKADMERIKERNVFDDEIVNDDLKLACEQLDLIVQKNFFSS